MVGGTRGIGLHITPWLVEKGARNLILVSRTGIATKEAHEIIDNLKANGVNVEVCPCDIGDQNQVHARLGALLERMPQVRGVLYGAMLLRVSPSILPKVIYC